MVLSKLKKKIHSYRKKGFYSTYSDPGELFKKIKLENWIVYKVVNKNKDRIKYVLSIGEGNCAWVAKLALNFPHIEFHAYDVDQKLCRIGEEFISKIGLKNVYIYCSDSPCDIGVKYDLAYARGVFQYLAKKEISKVVRKADADIFVVDWYPNMPNYLIIRLLQSIRHRSKRIFVQSIFFGFLSWRRKNVNCKELEKVFKRLNYKIVKNEKYDHSTLCYLVAVKDEKAEKYEF